MPRQHHAQQGTIFDLQSYALYDGPGIRSALYLKGCPLRCYWCHNPEAQCFEAEVFHWPDRAETVGETIDATEAAARLLADKPFFDRSGGGVTITGGEPTSQPSFLVYLLKLLRDRGIHTTLETCGFFSAALANELTKLVDLFLFDIKHVNSPAHRRATGRDNRRIAENFASILASVGAKRITPRVPLIPGFNADLESMAGIARFLAETGYAGEVHLMPYHGWAKSKYQALGRAADYPQIEEPSARQVDAACEQLRARGFEPVLYG